jgi:uncharacterized protein YndB with AHSA1/START domain
MKKEALRVSCVVPTTPHAVWSAWLDSGQHTAFTGSKAVIDSAVGGKFTAWDGYIQGKNLQLDLGRRIIQSWRTTEFPKGDGDSRLEIHFEPVFDGTRITILHSDIPEGQGEKYKSGWNDHYFQPMRAYFGKMAIKADRASMVRMQQRASQPQIGFEDEDEEEETTAKNAKGKKGAAVKGAAKEAPSKSTKAAPAPAGKIAKAAPEKKGDKKAEMKAEKVAAKPAKAEKKTAKAEKKAEKKAAKAEKKAAKAEKKADKKAAKKSDKKAKKKK